MKIGEKERSTKKHERGSMRDATIKGPKIRDGNVIDHVTASWRTLTSRKHAATIVRWTLGLG